MLKKFSKFFKKLGLGCWVQARVLSLLEAKHGPGSVV